MRKDADQIIKALRKLWTQYPQFADELLSAAVAVDTNGEEDHSLNLGNEISVPERS